MPTDYPNNFNRSDNINSHETRALRFHLPLAGNSNSNNYNTTNLDDLIRNNPTARTANSRQQSQPHSQPTQTTKDSATNSFGYYHRKLASSSSSLAAFSTSSTSQPPNHTKSIITDAPVTELSSSTPSSTLLANSLSSYIIDDCQQYTTTTSTSAAISQQPQLVNCSNANLNPTNTIPQLIGNMNINHEELNFGQFEDVWLVKSWQEILFRVLFVIPIVLLGILGNLTIIYSICKFKRFRTKPTNIFILNMAIADLLTTIVCPTAALFTDIYQFYVLGSFLCRFEGFIKITCLLVSAYSLIVLSFDWLLSVVRPCRTRISIRQSWLTLVSIWVVSILMASPLFVWRRLRERQWKDVMEVWCCELIQYTKYYWVGITFFLIYLPTLIMTIVLVVILAQMDQFEAKLRRSRNSNTTNNNNSTHAGKLSHTWSTSTSTLAGVGSASPSISALGGSPSSSSVSPPPRTMMSTPSTPSTSTPSSINMKYRRRIVKILFTYLLTSMICWTPLQFTIIYRHFRSEAVPAAWFFELVFFAQLFASLSSAMNPIIFGFLSQPFRQIVTKSWMFRLVDKMRISRNATNRNNNNNQNDPNNQPNNQIPMNHQARLNNNNYLNFNRSSQRRTRSRDQTPQPRLTIESNEQQMNQQHNHQNHHHHHHQRQQRITAKRDSLTVSKQSTTTNNNHQQQHQVGCTKRILSTHNLHGPIAVATTSISTPGNSRQADHHQSTAAKHNNNINDNNNNNINGYNTKRVSFEKRRGPADPVQVETRNGHENVAFEHHIGDDDDDDENLKGRGTLKTIKVDETRGENADGVGGQSSSTSTNGHSSKYSQATEGVGQS